jgi:hypothetical protein
MIAAHKHIIKTNCKDDFVNKGRTISVLLW